MNPLAPFLAWLRARRLAKIAAAEERRRIVIKQQIDQRKAAHREFTYLNGDLREATNRALAAGCGYALPVSRPSSMVEG